MDESEWQLAHPIRESYLRESAMFDGSVDVDGTYVGDRRTEMPKSERKTLRGMDKVVVAGLKDQMNRVRTKTVSSNDPKTLDGVALQPAANWAAVYMDECNYRRISVDHETGCYKASEYVREQTHVQEIESFWSIPRRAHKCTLHNFSPKQPKHLNCNVAEFAGKPLRYRDLTADNGLASGAQS